MLKFLFWDKTGFILWYKWLEKLLFQANEREQYILEKFRLPQKKCWRLYEEGKLFNEAEEIAELVEADKEIS